MIGSWIPCYRFYHTTKMIFATGSSGSLLGKLRKSTGFSISNCKKALEKFPGDLQKAEDWLNEEAKRLGNWTKWNKIQNRKAAQGLIGVYAEDNLGIMVEVNCETDFVARNMEFRNLVGNVLLSCLEKTKEYEVARDKEFQKYLLTEDDLMSLKCKSFTMQELLNAAISKFNEKTVLKRAIVLKTKLPVTISGLSHPIEQCPNFEQVRTGKFGALIAYHLKGEQDCGAFGINMCQHIIGMNPLSIGAEDFNHLNELGKLNVDDKKLQDVVPPQDVVSSPDIVLPQDTEQPQDVEDTLQSELKDSDETRLLFQPYLLDPNLHVYNYVGKQADILDFERFECVG